eukprot:TRINITY_DN4160_c0_g2_i1.p1 TRINITY_DN4160_c0_g2~~TRINITY_DN4160_c0_g2_i1.p1  ORF type:complete len:340 (+),score=137.63 TRINITY_DN4160_c0_g2_i1:113-1132(+)
MAALRVVAACVLLEVAACIWDDAEEAEMTDPNGVEEEGAWVEEEDAAEVRPWMEPHYFMRQHMYADHQSTRASSYVPLRQEVLETTYKIVKLGREFVAEDGTRDLRNQSIHLNFGKDAKFHKKDLVVHLSDETVEMKGAKGETYTCHVPTLGDTATLDAAEVNQLVAKADKDMAADIGQGGCWVASMSGFGMEFCWNKTYTVFGINSRGRRTKHTLIGTMPNKTHHYQVVPEGVYHDPLVLQADYTLGDECPTPDPFTNETRRWGVNVFFHCTMHSPDHAARDRWGSHPRPVPWTYSEDKGACRYRLDLWSKGVCTATLPLLHLNRKYIICLEDAPGET